MAERDTLPASELADTVPHEEAVEGRTASSELGGELLAERYRMLEPLGAGGMGTVYVGEHVEIRKRVALKLLSPELRANPTAVERFLQEARTASRIGHEHIVEITDFGRTSAGVPFFAMELLDGEDLRALVKREGPLPWPRVRAILLQILDALEAAHQSGVIHRDMKPANCFRITRGGNPDFIKVLDFGLAKVIGDHPDYQSLSGTGAVMGTARYMSPEQARSETLDPRTDVYSAGVVAFELLTAEAPFRAANFVGVLSLLLTEPTPRMADVAPDVEVPAAVEKVVRRAMAKDRNSRYSSAAEFAAALREIPATAAPGSRHRSPVAWIFGGIAALVGVVGLARFAASQAVGEPPPVAEVVESAPDMVKATPPDLAPETREEPELEEVEPEPQPAEVEPAPTAELAPDLPATKEASTKPKPGHTAPKPSSKPAPSPEPEAEPEPPRTLGREQLAKPIAAAERGAKACGKKHGALLPTVKVKFRVEPSGKVASAVALAPMAGTPVGTCAAEAVLGQDFPVSREGVSDTVTLPLR